jgi:heme-degrading monooxygenase HmoA
LKPKNKEGVIEMIELHVYLEPQAGKEQDVVDTFKTHFVPAISVQEGFRSVALFKPHDSLRGHVIALRFDTEEQRLKWVASDAHNDAFPRIIALCSSITWRNHDVVEAASS